MTKKKTKQQQEPETVQFNGPAGMTTIPIYRGMVDDLPPMWNVRYEDAVQSFVNGVVGGAEFSVMITGIFTHLPDVPPPQRIDTRFLDRITDRDTIRQMVECGVRIMEYLRPEPEDAAEGDEAPND